MEPTEQFNPISPQTLNRFQHLLRLQYLLTVGPAVVFTSKASGNYAATFVSENITQITGYAPANFLDDPDFWVNHVHPDDLPHIFKGLEQLGTQDLLRHEYRFLHQDGQYRWMLNELRLIRDEIGEPIEIVGFLSDISSRKQAEADLEASERRLREIISKTIDGLLILDQQGQIIFSNPAAESLFGCRLSPLDNASLGIPITLQQSFEIDIPQSNGDIKVIETRIEEINWQGEKAFLAALRDISARKLLAVAIVEDQTELIARFLPDTTILFVNEAYCRFFGVNRQDVIGFSYQPVIYEADRERVTQLVQSMNAQNPVVVIENRVFNGQGEVRWTQWVNRMLFDNYGQLMEIQSVGRDITELKEAEAELKRSRISRSLVGNMLRDLESEGNLSEITLFQAGQKLASRVEAKTLEEFLDAFASMGLGTLALVEKKNNRWKFTGDNLVSVNTGQDQPTCHYPRGYLCGAIAQLTQTTGQIAAVEMECQSMNDPLCVFVVQVTN